MSADGMKLGETPAGEPEAQAQPQGVKVRVMAVGAAPQNIFVQPGATFGDVLGQAQIDVRGNLEFRNVAGASRAVQPNDQVTEEGILTVKPAIQGGDVLELVQDGNVVAKVVIVQVLDNGLVVSYVPVA